MRKDRRRLQQATVPAANGHATGNELTRTTIFLTENENRNLDLVALREGRSKGDLVREAVDALLVGKGLKPDRTPTNIRVEYAYD